MKKSVPAVFLALFLIPAALDAQNYAIEILPDKNVIYVDKLGLPGTTSLEELLHMLPELLNREASNYFSNFDIQYEGKSTREGRDVILTQTKLSELEKVEISSSPTVTQQKNGQGGVVNIIPRKLDEGVSGDASVGLATLVDVMPGVNANFKKNKLELRSSLNFEYYAPETHKPSTLSSPGKTINSVDTLKRRYIQETARINMKYDFSGKDVLKAWLTESWMRGHSNTATFSATENDMAAQMGEGWKFVEYGRKLENQTNSVFYLTAMSEYKHEFEDASSITASVGYEFQKERNEQPEKNYSSTLNRPHSLNSELKYSADLVKNEKRSLKLDLGANLNYDHSYTATQEGGNLYVSPFVNFKYNTGPWTVHAGVRYQCNMREYNVIDEDLYNKTEHDFSANVNATWQLAPHHSLRFLAMRNLTRPSDAQLYPVLTFDILQNMWMKGNSRLATETIHTAEVNYVHDWSSGGHYLVFNTMLGYDRCDNLIQKKIIGEKQERDLGLQLMYYTFNNSGINDIIRTNVCLFYTYGIFSMSFSGNLFYNIINLDGAKDRYFNYNLCFSPVFHFKKQWVLSSNAVYNGPVSTIDSDLGDCFYMRISLNKTIRKWTLTAVLSDVFDYVSVDVSRSGEGYYISQYDMYQRYVAIGATYRF